MMLFMKKHLHLLAVLSIAGQGLIYMLIASLISDHSVPINGSIDDHIPYLPWFIISYIAWMPVLYIAFIYLGFTNRSLYWRSMITYHIAVTVSNIIFILFPTSMPRPDVTANDIFNTLVLFIYSNDQPVNCFPSIHCLTSYLLLITLNRHKLFSWGPRLLLSVFFWSIIASTVFVKQHALVDVIGGIALAEITYRVVYHILDKQQKVMITEQHDARATMNG